MTTTPTATISTDIAELGGVTGARGNALREALERISRWHGEFPETGETWPDGTPTSYSAEYGSNGERDYMRQVAINALAAPVAPEPAAVQEHGLIIAAGYEGGTLAFDPTQLGATINLHYESPTEAEQAFGAITEIIDAANRPPQPLAEVSAAPEGLHERLRDALSIELGSAMDCTRVWSAWGVGTMGENDFQLLADNDERLDDLVGVVLAAIAGQQPTDTTREA